MAIIVGKTTDLLLVAGAAMMLNGCGMAQKMTDGTLAVTQAIFYKQIKNLHLDIRTREAVNGNAQGVALSTVVRIYQLKDRKTFDATDYPALFTDDTRLLNADVLVEKDILLQPGGAVTVDMPMDDRTRFVAVAGMFISPDLVNNTWRVVIARNECDPDNARIIEAGNHHLMLKNTEDK